MYRCSGCGEKIAALPPLTRSLFEEGYTVKHKICGGEILEG